MSPTRIIGLGNSILSDDAAGLIVVQLLRECGVLHPEIELVETEVAGFDLLELMCGCQRVLLVDTVQFDGVEPGTILRIAPDDLRTSLRLRSAHEIDLPTGCSPWANSSVSPCHHASRSMPFRLLTP